VFADLDDPHLDVRKQTSRAQVNSAFARSKPVAISQDSKLHPESGRTAAQSKISALDNTFGMAFLPKLPIEGVSIFGSLYEANTELGIATSTVGGSEKSRTKKSD